jgi:CHAT domain-containing protein
MPAPVVLLLGCASTAPGDGFDGLPGSFIDMGATAVVSTLTSVQGAQAAAAAGAIVSAMHSNRLSSPTLATALMEARRQLVARGLVVGLLLVAHGELDIPISAQPTRA